MTIVLTTAGTNHLVQLDAGGALTYAFDGLTFGAGNDTPAVGDQYGASAGNLTEELGFFVRVQNGYPKKGDTDARNGGSGADVWTWRYVIAAGSPFVASNLMGMNYSGGIPVDPSPALVSGKQTIAQRYDERLVVWINAATGQTPTVFTAFETSLENRIQRVVGFVARNRALGGNPSGSVVDDVTVRTRPRPGQHVWTAASLEGPDGRSLRPEDVSAFVLAVERLDAATGHYETFNSLVIDCAKHVYAVPQFGDQRWNAAGGYNTAHAWAPPPATPEQTWRLTYRMVLCDGDVREWVNQVEVRSGRS